MGSTDEPRYRPCAPLRLSAAVLGALLLALVSCAGVAWSAPSPAYFSALPASGSSELHTGRYAPTITALPGGEVLIAGGFNEKSDFLRSAELFNPTTNTFKALPASGETELHVARAYAAASVLPGGQVLIAGGYAPGRYLRSAELFNPATGTFTALPASGETQLHTGRMDVVAAPLPNGDVLIAGGRDQDETVLQSAELFNPAADTFAALPASGATELQDARESPVAAPLPGGDVLIAGGNDGGYLKSAELFNPAADTFTALPAAGATELQSARTEAIAAALPGGEVLIAGGDDTDNLQSAELFNPAGDTFTALGASGSSEMQVARAYGGAATLPNGTVLIAGGENAGGEPRAAELFFPAPQAAAPAVAFGPQAVGVPSPSLTVLVTNVGAQALSISSISLAGPDPQAFAVTSDSCSGRTLAFEQACSISARFDPAAGGASSAAIALSDNEPSPTAIALSGTGVAPAPLPAAGSGPVLSTLKESARVWRDGGALARMSAHGRKKAPPVGTSFSFDLSEAASVTFTFTEPAGGRLAGRTCAAPSRSDAHGRRCARTITAGTLTFTAHAGLDTLRFDGVISRHVKLRPGSYTLQATASTAAGHSARQSLPFTIAKG